LVLKDFRLGGAVVLLYQWNTNPKRERGVAVQPVFSRPSLALRASIGCGVLLSAHHCEVVHWANKLVAHGFAHAAGNLLVELFGENLFRPAAVEVGRFAYCFSHGLEHLSEQQFAQDLLKLLAGLAVVLICVELGNVRGRVIRCKRNGGSGGH